MLQRLPALFAANLTAFFLFAALAPRPLAAQTVHGFPFRANNYDVEVLVHPQDQTISALAKVEFIAQSVSRTVVVELHPDLKINSVSVAGGKALEFERDVNAPLLLTVGLPDVVAPGHTVN